jgi:hypothetical protein
MKCRDCHYFKNHKCKVYVIGIEEKEDYKGDTVKFYNDTYFNIYESFWSLYTSPCDYNYRIYEKEIESCILNKNECCKYFVDKNIYCKDCVHYHYGERLNFDHTECHILHDIGYNIGLDHKGNKTSIPNDNYYKIINIVVGEDKEDDIFYHSILNEDKNCEYFKPKKIKKPIVSDYSKNRKKKHKKTLKEKLFAEFGKF